MRARIQRWGNSLAIRIPKPYAKDLMFKEGLAVDLEISGDALVVKPVASAYELAALLAMVTPDNLHELVDFGPPVGKEVW